MPLVNAVPILQAARAGRYAVGAFNAHNMEFVQGILRAAEELDAPVILQVSGRTIQYAGLRTMASMVRAAAQESSVPVVMHLDHADYDLNIRCLVAGFTSLMLDGAALPFGLNVEETHRVVEAAHVLGVPVEAELGHVNGKRDEHPAKVQDYTDPDAAHKFVTLSGVDHLAVMVGKVPTDPSHPPRLDVDRIRAISKVTGVPLVVYHTDGLEPDEIKEAIASGLCKVGTGRELHAAFTLAVREASARAPEQLDPRPILSAGRTAIAQLVKEKIKLFGSAGKAKELAPLPTGAR